MTALELARTGGEATEPTSRRVVRGGVRVAGLGLTALDAARSLRSLRGAADREGARERALVLREASRRVLDLHEIELDVRGPLPLGAAIVASNHVSWLDPLVVASVLPCVPISKADVSGWPVIGSLARELGVVFFSRGDAGSGAQVLRAAASALAHGLSVLNFPEGTTTIGASVLTFRKGLFGLARTANVPVFPAAIAYDPTDLAWVGDAPFLPHYLKLAGGRRARAVLRFGEPLEPAAHPTAADLAAATRERVLELLRERA
ncbi:MAG TPA: lysophospholipid acyltransferase family protein [Anaeromyxobacteraceae bacterium]